MDRIGGFQEHGVSPKTSKVRILVTFAIIPPNQGMSTAFFKLLSARTAWSKWSPFCCASMGSPLLSPKRIRTRASGTWLTCHSIPSAILYNATCVWWSHLPVTSTVYPCETRAFWISSTRSRFGSFCPGLLPSFFVAFPEHVETRNPIASSAIVTRHKDRSFIKSPSRVKKPPEALHVRRQP